jgi:hypothetical protein
VLNAQYQAASAAAAAAGGAEAAAAHSAAVVAALNALAAFADWAPMARISALGVVEAAAFLLGAADLRDPALEVLRQVRVARLGWAGLGWAGLGCRLPRAAVDTRAA